MNISIVIATLGRENNLENLFLSLEKQSEVPFEILLIHQGEEAIDTLLQKFQHLPIRYFHFSWKSLTRARNVGVKESRGEVIGFLDDDIILEPDYIKNIRLFFETHQGALGVQGLISNFTESHIAKLGSRKYAYLFYNIFAKIFLLNNSSSKNKLLLSGRNQYASQPKGIEPCEWLSGIGNYKRVVFDTFSFDETLQGYALGEDKLFSYQIFQKFPGTLWLDPAILCTHTVSIGGRPENKEWVEMKVQYTYYLWKKLFASRGFVAMMAYWWANLGDILLVAFSVFLGQNERIFLSWHIQEYKSLWKKQK